MAMMDGNDPNNGAGDWWTQNAPDPAAPPTTAPANTDEQNWLNTVQGYYRQYLGRDGSDAELRSWLPSGIAGAEAGIRDSAEARARRPGDPVIPPGGGGAPAPTVTTQPIGVPTSGFGAAPPVYASDPAAPVYQPMPAYVAPTWTGGDFVNPTEADLLASPGYQARLDNVIKTRERASAAQGTILNGGTLKALDRAGQDYATGEYQTLRGNALDAYKLRYGQFTDKAGMDLNARTINANENQTTFANRTATYNTNNARTLSDYLTNVTSHRNAELDYWGRLKDVNNTGADLGGGSYRV